MSSDNMNTQPTIETVLDRITQLSTNVEKRFDQIDKRFDQVDKRFDQTDQRIANIEQDVAEIKKSIAVLERQGRRIDIRLDKVESVALSSRSEIQDLHDQLLERIPGLK
jgi:septal ring factor EnvC (AmiA/AmiB activator)